MRELTRDEVRRVIEGRGAAPRIPLAFDHWIGDNLFGGDVRRRDQWLTRYPRDVEVLDLNLPGLSDAPKDDLTYRWVWTDGESVRENGLDNRIYIREWDSPEGERFFPVFPARNTKGWFLRGRMTENGMCWPGFGSVILNGCGCCGGWKMP